MSTAREHLERLRRKLALCRAMGAKMYEDTHGAENDRLRLWFEVAQRDRAGSIERSTSHLRSAGVEGGNVMVRDPWNGGSTYGMTHESFFEVWTGVAAGHF